jgi:hypothetical protein
MTRTRILGIKYTAACKVIRSSTLFYIATNRLVISHQFISNLGVTSSHLHQGRYSGGNRSRTFHRWVISHCIDYVYPLPSYYQGFCLSLFDKYRISLIYSCISLVFSIQSIDRQVRESNHYLVRGLTLGWILKML